MGQRIRGGRRRLRLHIALELACAAIVAACACPAFAADSPMSASPAKKIATPHTVMEAEMPTWSAPLSEQRDIAEATDDTALPQAMVDALLLDMLDDEVSTVLDELPVVTTSDDSTDTPDDFNNGCTPPRSWRDVEVPKTLTGLAKQTGTGFHVARRGPFLIASDLASKDFSSLVDGVLKCCRECLERDYFASPPTEVVTIYAFKDETSYVSGLDRIFQMKPISPYGHYGHAQRYIVINYDTGPGTLVHELTHALMAPDFPEAPIWISEGIASLYEQCRVEGESLIGEANWRLPELKDALQKESLTPLTTLFALTPRRFRARRESLHYAQSRYFCMYLESKGTLRRVYSLFRNTFDIDPTGLAAVETVMGKSIDEVEADWHAWLQTQAWQ